MVFNRSEARSQKNRQLSSCTCTRISNKTLFGSSLPSSEKECCQRWNRIRTCFGLNSPLDHPLAERYLFHMCIKRGPNTQRIYMLSIEMGRGEDTCCCQSNGRVSVCEKIPRTKFAIDNKSATGMHHTPPCLQPGSYILNVIIFSNQAP